MDREQVAAAFNQACEMLMDQHEVDTETSARDLAHWCNLTRKLRQSILTVVCVGQNNVCGVNAMLALSALDQAALYFEAAALAKEVK